MAEHVWPRRCCYDCGNGLFPREKSNAINDKLITDKIIGIVQAIVTLSAVDYGLGKMPEDLTKTSILTTEKVGSPRLISLFLSTSNICGS